MAINKIIKGYKNLLISLLSFFVLICLCVTAAFGVVYPLWTLADKYPAVYTVFCFIVFGSAVLFFVIKRVITAYKESPYRLFISFVKKFILAAGTAGFIFFIAAAYNRTAGISILIFSIIIYGFVTSVYGNYE